MNTECIISNQNQVVCRLASLVESRLYAIKNNRDEWREGHEDNINLIMKDAPSGSGFDSGTKILLEECSRNKLVFKTSFHHISGTTCMYTEWTEHIVTITPAFNGYDINVGGINKNEIKGYIDEVFEGWLSSMSKV